MARATAHEVKAIIDTDLDTADVEPFLRAANLTVTEHLDGEGLSDDLLLEVERWLAAHLVAVRDPRVSQKSVDDLSLRYEGQAGMGLDRTRYGQQAKALDPTGRLAGLDETRRPVQFRVADGFGD